MMQIVAEQQIVVEQDNIQLLAKWFGCRCGRETLGLFSFDTRVGCFDICGLDRVPQDAPKMDWQCLRSEISCPRIPEHDHLGKNLSRVHISNRIPFVML